MNRTISSPPAWILCRNLKQFPIDDDATLLQWTRQGRVMPSDYLVSTRLDTCVEAREVAGVAAILRAKTIQAVRSIARRVVFAGIAFSIAFLALASTGCSLRVVAANQIGDAIAGGGATYASDDDPELIGEALPFSLKLMESLLAETPNHKALLLAVARGFTQYAYGWVAPAERSQRLYLRARDYGLRALATSIPDVRRRLADEPGTALSSARKGDVAALYWTAAAWGLAVSGAKDDPEMLADLPIVEALISRAAELDPDFEHGAIDGFLVSYEASRAGVSRGAEERAREHFRRAVELSGGQSAEPFVTAAEALAVPQQDRPEFELLLARALAVDVNAKPEWRLANIISRRRAAWLLEHADDFFLTPEARENTR